MKNAATKHKNYFKMLEKEKSEAAFDLWRAACF